MAKYPMGFSTSWNAAGVVDGEEIAREVIEIKTAIERIREMVQNIE